MKAGDIKRCLEKAISSENRDGLDPKAYNINDSFILNAIRAYKNGESPEHIKALVEGFIETESLTVRRRVAVLKMVCSVLSGLAQPNTTQEDRERLRSLLIRNPHRTQDPHRIHSSYREE